MEKICVDKKVNLTKLYSKVLPSQFFGNEQNEISDRLHIDRNINLKTDNASTCRSFNYKSSFLFFQ